MFRPTVSCIWTSFRSSGKRHLILTGKRHSGKTTLLSALFPEVLPGITTWAVPGRGVYLKENGTQNVVQAGVFDDTLPGTENRMRVSQEGFGTLGMSALLRCMESDNEWVSMDEIGYLENGHPGYCDAIRNVMKNKRLAAVVRKQELPFLQEILHSKDVFLVDMDGPFGKSGCVIMASGLGTRFGGNKLMADFQGQPLLCRVLEATKGVFAQRVVVTRYQEAADLCRERGIQVVLHDLPHRSDTVRLGMEALTDVECCMFCPADQPLIRRDTVGALTMASANDTHAIWRAGFDGTAGSPVLFPAWTFSELRTLPVGRGGGVIIKKYPEHVRIVNVPDKYELWDVDRQEDLRMLEGR